MLYVGLLPPHPGGAPISCTQLLSGFAGLGHRVRALAPITKNAYPSGDSFALKHPEIDVTRYLVPYDAINPVIPGPDEYRRLEQKSIQENLQAMIAKERPDIIIIGRESFVIHVLDIAEFYSIPCVLTVRGGTTLGILKGSYPEPLANRFLNAYHRVNLLITVARHFEQSLSQLGLKNIKTIMNSVDLNQFYPKPKNKALLRELVIRDENIIVIQPAVLKSIKRPLDLVNSAVEAMRQNSRLVYVVVGDGELRKTMEEACHSKNIRNKFRFVGWVDYDRMPDYINVADIVVMPSEGEGLSRVYLETQACARLLLASDIPPAREVIVHGETGLLFRMGDIDDLTEKTVLAAGDPQLRADIGRRARDRTVKAHSLDDAISKYVETLREIVQR